MSAPDDETLEHPLVAAVRAVASLAEQRDLLAYLLHVAVYKMHPTTTIDAYRVSDPPPDPGHTCPCGFHFRVPSDEQAVGAMLAILAEQRHKADDAGRDFMEHGEDLLARWHAAREQ